MVSKFHFFYLQFIVAEKSLSVFKYNETLQHHIYDVPRQWYYGLNSQMKITSKYCSLSLLTQIVKYKCCEYYINECDNSIDLMCAGTGTLTGAWNSYETEVLTSLRHGDTYTLQWLIGCCGQANTWNSDDSLGIRSESQTLSLEGIFLSSLWEIMGDLKTTHDISPDLSVFWKWVQMAIWTLEKRWSLGLLFGKEWDDLFS